LEVTEMSISKVVLAIIVSAILSTTALAQQQAPAQGGAAPAGAQGGASSDSGVTLDVTPFFTAVDTNKDNKITPAEWKAAGLDESVYEKFDKEKTGSISKESLASKTHPPTIDANKDGKFSLDELKAHIKSQAQSSGGGAQGGAAPAAGAQGAPQGGAPGK
jgi:hypothetical protein